MAGSRLATTPRERGSRLVYGVLWSLATPIIMAYLLWRARRQPAYRRDWMQRFLGRYGKRDDLHGAKPCIWVHAVSVGETRAAAPLIEALLGRDPGFDVLLTHMTPTGRETAEALFGDRVRHAYLAYDYPHATAAFLRHWRPRLGIVMETEIWPNLMAAAERSGVAMLLANARLSARSLVSARRWPSLMRPAARRFARILAQTEADAKRFALLTETEGSTSSSIVVGGNVKFDIEVPEAQRRIAESFRRLLPAGTCVFLCASTRDGEEEGILDAWKKHGCDREADGSRRLLVIVPRHPQRFEEIVDQATIRGFTVQRRSDGQSLRADTQVWIGDSMGELSAYYLSSTVAYVGGSIVPLGGQNLIEAAACGCPVLIGRHTFNFAAASDEAVRSGAAVRVADFEQLVRKGLALADDPAHRRRMREAGIAFAAAHRGATKRTMEVVDLLLDSWGPEARKSRS